MGTSLEDEIKASEPTPFVVSSSPPLFSRLLDPEHAEAVKICLDCQEALPVSAFYTHATAKGGRQARCKECDRKRRAVVPTHGIEGERMARKLSPTALALANEKAANDELAAKAKERAPYVGITGGYLLWGYVK
jgi:hypothetical protein